MSDQPPPRITPLSRSPSLPSPSSSSSPLASYASPPPSCRVFNNPFNRNHNDALVERKRISKVGLTLALALFGASTALFLSGPPTPNDHAALYKAYLMLVYLAIITSSATSIFFFIMLGTHVFNWKINSFIGISGLFLMFSFSVRFALSLPHVQDRIQSQTYNGFAIIADFSSEGDNKAIIVFYYHVYTPCVWSTTVIFLLLIVFYFRYNNRLIHARTVASLPVPAATPRIRFAPCSGKAKVLKKDCLSTQSVGGGEGGKVALT